MSETSTTRYLLSGAVGDGPERTRKVRRGRSSGCQRPANLGERIQGRMACKRLSCRRVIVGQNHDLHKGLLCDWGGVFHASSSGRRSDGQRQKIQLNGRLQGNCVAEAKRRWLKDIPVE